MGSVRTGVMLAYPVDEKRLSKMPEKVIFQRKLNGERAKLSWTPSGDPIILSSCGNEMPFFKSFKKEISSSKLFGVELDGEFYCHGMPREEIHSICSRRKNPHPYEDSLSFHAFDIVDEDASQSYRTIELEELLENDLEFTKLVKSSYADKAALIPFTEQWIKDGYEGAIIRHPNALYTPRKCNFMLKFKPTEIDIYEIVGYQEEVDKYGFLKGRLGSVHVKDSDGHVFSIGTGNDLDADGRTFWWKNRDTLKGLHAKVKHSTIMTVNGFPTCTSLLSILIGKEKEKQ